ncbi:hypothetical protein EVAR_8842_1 [Eumeta japonica]|uniref:Calphotin-like n=1 Tax=Eumeta variegata TaxID=151549 RepID=A0A4C1TUC3_EUMVA|nr:hypothetical protein EVAR_8842_1 [Eumeta japonica]
MAFPPLFFQWRRWASATSATADGLAPEGLANKKFAYKLLKRGLAKSFAYKLLKRGLANLMSPTSTSGVAPPLIKMKYLVVFAAVIGIALAAQKPILAEEAQLEAIIAAIQSPNTDPATAALLEQQLQDILGSFLNPAPVEVGPAIVDSHPISVGPAIVDTFEPISVGPALVDFDHVEPAPVDASPAVVPPAAAASSPLVQIILNIQQSSAGAAPVEVTPVNPAMPSFPDQVQVVDHAPAPAEPVQVVETAPEPVQVVESAPEPVQVVEIAPVAPVVMPETLN